MHVRSAEFVKSGRLEKEYPEEDLPEVAFGGRSNVGKSSLMNSLMHRKSLVKVSNTPGRTQLLNWFRVNGSLLLCDLPGYGFARVPASIKREWGAMIERYLQRRKTLYALVVIVDVRRGFEEDDRLLVQSTADMGLQPILVATKCDRIARQELYRRKLAISREMGASLENDIIWYSSKDHTGRDALWRRITNLLPVVSDEPPSA